MENVGCTPKQESPIDKAKQSLRDNIEQARDIAGRFEAVLADVLTEPEKETTIKDSDVQPPQCSLESYLWTMNDLVVRLKRYLSEIQKRVQL